MSEDAAILIVIFAASVLAVDVALAVVWWFRKC